MPDRVIHLLGLGRRGGLEAIDDLLSFGDCRRQLDLLNLTLLCESQYYRSTPRRAFVFSCLSDSPSVAMAALLSWLMGRLTH